MKAEKILMVVACTLAGGVMLAGCQSNGSSNAGGSGAATPVTSAAGTSGSAGASPGNGQDTSSASSAGSTASTGAAGGGGNGGSGSGDGICQAGDLKISLDGDNKVSSQIIEWVQLENSTSTPCTMDGFAGVNLVGSANGRSNYTWSLTRDDESYSKFVLNPGESAYFGIKYLPWTSGDSAKINVANIVLTPPNTTTSVTLPWSASVLLQDTATRPGTYLTPIALGDNG